MARRCVSEEGHVLAAPAARRARLRRSRASRRPTPRNAWWKCRVHASEASHSTSGSNSTTVQSVTAVTVAKRRDAVWRRKAVSARHWPAPWMRSSVPRARDAHLAAHDHEEGVARVVLAHQRRAGAHVEPARHAGRLGEALAAELAEERQGAQLGELRGRAVDQPPFPRRCAAGRRRSPPSCRSARPGRGRSRARRFRRRADSGRCAMRPAGAGCPAGCAWRAPRGCRAGTALPHQHLVHHDAERIHVGLHRGGLALELLGRHVRGRAHHERARGVEGEARCAPRRSRRPSPRRRRP